MPQITSRFSYILWSLPDLDLTSSFPWKSYVRQIKQPSSNGSGFFSNSGSGSFNSLTTIKTGSIVELDLKNLPEGGILLETGTPVTTLPQPLITSVSPLNGAVGTVVTITGVNLGGVTEVTINGTLANVSSNTSTEVVFTVPSNSDTGLPTLKTNNGAAYFAFPFTVEELVIPPAPSNLTYSSSSGTLVWAGGNAEEYEYSTLATPNILYDVPLYPFPVGDLAGNEVRLRFKATATTPAGVWSSPVTVTPVVSALLSLASADFTDNLIDLDGGGFRKRSPLATFSFETDATSLTANVIAPLAENEVTPGCILSIFDSTGTFVTSITPTSAAPQDITFTLPGTGVRRYLLVEGASSERTDTDFAGSYLQSLKRNNGTRLNKITALLASKRILIGGDSIANGYVTTNNSRFGFVPRLRSKLGNTWQVALSGFAGAHAYARFPTASSQQAEADRIVAYLAGATTKIYMDFVGTNAFGYRPVPPAQEAQVKASIWDKVHAKDASIRIVQVHPMVRPDQNNANGLGYKLVDYVTAYSNEVASRLAWVQESSTLLDPWLTLLRIKDGVHPDDEGHELMAVRSLSIATTPYTPPAAKSEKSLSINVAASVNEGTTVNAPVTVTYSDNTTEVVTTSVSYSSDIGNYTSGTFTILPDDVVGNNRQATLAASYKGLSTSIKVNIVDTTQAPPTSISGTWLGVFGTTSDNPVQNPVRSFSEFRDITASDYGYFMAGGYNEDRATVKWFASHETRNKHFAVMAAMTTVVDHIVSDGPWVYVAVNGNDYNNSEYKSAVVRINAQTRAKAPFSAGTYWNTTAGEFFGVSLFDNGNYKQDDRLLSGIAVEKNNTLLAAARRKLNTVQFANKTTGAAIGTVLSIPTPKKMCFGNDGVLWIITGGQLKRYTNSADRNNPNFVENSTVGGLVAPLAMAVKANGNMLVMDGGTSQQIKEYTAAGNLVNNGPFLAGGNKVSNPDISPFRLHMTCRGGLATQNWPREPYDTPMGGLTVDKDNSYWVCDCGNFRVQHYDQNWQYLGQSAFMPDLFKVCVDPTDPTCVMVDFQQYKVYWDRPIKYGDQTVLPENERFWMHVKNWSAGQNVRLDTGLQPMHWVQTINMNGKSIRYALMDNAQYHNVGWCYSIMEVPSADGVPLRNTGGRVTSGSSSGRPHHFVKHPDGRIGFGYWQEGEQKAYFIPIQGIDANNNLMLGSFNQDVIYASQETLVNFNRVANDPFPLGGWNMQVTLGITEDGTLVAHRAKHSAAGSFHVGGTKIGQNKWLWRNLPSKLVHFPENNWYPAIGSETRTYGNNGFGGHEGVGMVVVGKLIFCVYDGQNGKAANQTYVYHQDGTFLLQFGRPSQDNPDMTDDNRAPAGYSNNIGYICGFQRGNKVYILKTDEACFGAIHIDMYTLPPSLMPING